MPECIFGCAQINKPNPSAAPNWKDVKDLVPSPPASVSALAIVPDLASPRISAPVHPPSTCEDHHAFKIVSFLHHRKVLTEMWKVISGSDTAPVDFIQNMDLVSRSSDVHREGSYRQSNISGGVVQTIRELYEAANIAKPQFDGIMSLLAVQLSMAIHTHDAAPEAIVKHNGLVLNSLKPLVGISELISKKYLQFEPGPPCSWVFDVISASFICEGQMEILRIYEAIMSSPSVKVIKVENRFQRPTALGFRDILMNVQFDALAATGSTFKYVCEIQITDSNFKRYEIENETRALYEKLWPVLHGSDEDKEKRMELFAHISTMLSPIITAMAPPGTTNIVKAVEDVISKHCAEVHKLDDIHALEHWVDVLECIHELSEAEKLQRKVITLQCGLHGSDSLPVAFSRLRLGQLLYSQKQYTQAYDMYESSVICIGNTLSETSHVVEDILQQMAHIRICQGKAKPSASLEDEAKLVRKLLFESNGKPVKTESGRSTLTSRSSVNEAIPRNLGDNIDAKHILPMETNGAATSDILNDDHHEILQPASDLWDQVSSSDSEFESSI